MDSLHWISDNLYFLVNSLIGLFLLSTILLFGTAAIVKAINKVFDFLEARHK